MPIGHLENAPIYRTIPAASSARLLVRYYHTTLHCIAIRKDTKGTKTMSDWNQSIIEEFRAKGGRGVGHFGDRLLLLTTYGAKSGRPHTTPLAYHRDGDRYVIIASMGGAPKHPAWYHNLVANSEAEVEVGREKVRVRATALPSGPERDRLYEQQCQIMPGFRDYESMTERIIPVVLLESIETAAGRQAA